jgi:hypothetical protein
LGGRFIDGEGGSGGSKREGTRRRRRRRRRRRKRRSHFKLDCKFSEKCEKSDLDR